MVIASRNASVLREAGPGESVLCTHATGTRGDPRGVHRGIWVVPGLTFHIGIQVPFFHTRHHASSICSVVSIIC